MPLKRIEHMNSQLGVLDPISGYVLNVMPYRFAHALTIERRCALCLRYLGPLGGGALDLQFAVEFGDA
ncbi:MAG: hypothetical protein WD533_03610, partial [Dehalococcoidia bacterium]